MRTTIRIDEELLKEAKQLAIDRGKSFSSVIEDGLREYLAGQRSCGQRKPVRLPTTSGQGLVPGVDLDNSAALLDVMES